MAKQFKTAITSFYENNSSTERKRDEKLAGMTKDGYTLLSTLMTDRRILDTFVKDDESFSD